jgi:hypothetical protein
MQTLRAGCVRNIDTNPKVTFVACLLDNAVHREKAWVMPRRNDGEKKHA